MRRCLQLGLAVVAGVTVVSVVGTPARAETGESISRYDVALTVQSDGTLHVREAIAYDFGGNERHGIIRNIPVQYHYNDKYDRVYRLNHIKVRSPDHAPTDTKVDTKAEVKIRIGNPNRTITGRHAYVIDYDVEGALNHFTDHEELYWNAIGDEWDVPIAAGSAVVTTPVAITRIACYSGPTGSTQPCGSAVSDGRTARFAQSNLPPDQALTVVAALPAGSVPAKPILRERFAFSRAFAATPVTVGGLGLILLLVLGGVGWLLWNVGRDRRYVGQIPGLAPAAGQAAVEEHEPLFSHPGGAVEFAPPDGVRPGEIGTLLDESADVLDVTATIVDLAVRKHLFIEELPRKHWFAKRDWRLSKVDAPSDDLQPYERKLYDALFTGRDSVLVSELKDKFATNLREVRDALYDDVVSRGWFRRRPDKVRSSWGSGGFWLTVGAVALTWWLATHSHLGLIGVGLVLGGVALWFGSRFMPARTGLGSAVLSRVIGFRQYIKTAEVDQLRFEERETIFSRYLPYAIVFGETERWAKAFAQLGEQPQQRGNGLYWYSGPDSWNLAHFGSSMDSFATTASGVLASTPGGSGFGGGSGGGGGGGGGGSW